MKVKVLKESKSSKSHKIITLDVIDYDDEIENMLIHIGDVARGGHSFPVEVDPGSKGRDDGREYYRSCYIDGDGPVRLDVKDVEIVEDDE